MRDLIEEMANRNIGSLALFLKNKKNLKYLNYIDNIIPDNISTISEKVYYFINNINELLLCECGDRRKFIGFKDGYRSTCGKKDCYVSIRKKTCIEKYGVENILVKLHPRDTFDYAKHFPNSKILLGLNRSGSEWSLLKMQILEVMTYSQKL